MENYKICVENIERQMKNHTVGKKTLFLKVTDFVKLVYNLKQCLSSLNKTFHRN